MLPLRPRWKLSVLDTVFDTNILSLWGGLNGRPDILLPRRASRVADDEHCGRGSFSLVELSELSGVPDRTINPRRGFIS